MKAPRCFVVLIVILEILIAQSAGNYRTKSILRIEEFRYSESELGCVRCNHPSNTCDGRRRNGILPVDWKIKPAETATVTAVVRNDGHARKFRFVKMFAKLGTRVEGGNAYNKQDDSG